MRHRNLSEDYGVLTHIPPHSTARAAGSYVGDAIDAKQLERALAKLHLGILHGTATILMKWQHNSVGASSSADAAWVDVDATNCVTSTFASASNSKIGQLELRCDQYSGLGRYIRPYVLVATSSWHGCVEADGEPMGKPATGFDSADVVQTVVY